MIERRDFFRLMAAAGLLPLVRTAKAKDEPQSWDWVRAQFDIPADETYFNTGTLGARPRQVTQAVANHLHQIEQTIAHFDYKPDHPEYIAGYGKQEQLRMKIAPLFNAKAREIALTQNATMGTNFIANGIDLRPGDEVLMTDQEHVGNKSAWELREKREGIVVRKLTIGTPPSDPESVLRIFTEAITPRTRAIDVPHITSKLGIVLPVAQICAVARPRNIFTLVDGAQAIGHVRIDVKSIGCDAYTTSPHKWLLAPVANGLLYVAEDRLRDVWATLASGNWNNYDPADGAFRLMQFGTANLSLLVGLDAAIDFHNAIGPERIHQRIMELSNRLRDGLKTIDRAHIDSPTHPAMTSGIVTWGIHGVKGMELMDEMWRRRKIRVRSVDDNSVRQSCHFYNTPEEIDVTLEIARTLTRAA